MSQGACGLVEEEKINTSYINSRSAEVIHGKLCSDSDGESINTQDSSEQLKPNHPMKRLV